MIVSRKNECPQINISINENKLKQRGQFKYFDTLSSSDGRNNTEIASGIAQAKKTFQIMKSILIITSRFTQEEEPWSAILNAF